MLKFLTIITNMLRILTFIISAAFWLSPDGLIVNAASLTALFKHIGSVEEPSTDDVIREKVINFVRDKVSR